MMNAECCNVIASSKHYKVNRFLKDLSPDAIALLISSWEWTFSQRGGDKAPPDVDFDYLSRAPLGGRETF